MVYINEWFPNPVGADKGNEWVELFNGGEEPVSLGGWFLTNGTGKEFALNGKNIGAGQYLVLNPEEAKVTLRNTDELISLYDDKGNLVSQSRMLGSAPEGKSYSLAPTPERESSTGSTVGANSRLVWGFAEPTPGAANKIIKEFAAVDSYPLNQQLNKTFGYFDFTLLAIFVGLIYSFLTIAVFKRNEYLSKLFFGRD